MTTVVASQVLAEAQRMAGDAYVWGAETTFTDPHPEAFDCSELVQWDCNRLGFLYGDALLSAMPDGSWIQNAFCRDHGTLVTVEVAIATPAALLFRTMLDSHGNYIATNGHVAFSRGDGTTIEARGRAYGVNNFPAANRAWTGGGLIPGVNYAHGAQPQTPTHTLEVNDVRDFTYFPPGIKEIPAGHPLAGRTPYYWYIAGFRSLVGMNFAPIAGKRHDGLGRAGVSIPPKFGEVTGIGQSDSGIVLAFGDGGTYKVPFK